MSSFWRANLSCELFVYNEWASKMICHFISSTSSALLRPFVFIVLFISGTTSSRVASVRDSVMFTRFVKS